jgi:hypothetical protein
MIGKLEAEHYNSVFEVTRRTVLFLGINKSKPGIYIRFSPALHLQCKTLSFKSDNWGT